MKYETKFDIGHRYWAARCKRIVHEEVKEINGQVWVREYFTYEPYVKEKVVETISVQHTQNGTLVMYGVGDVEQDVLLRYFPEGNIEKENYTKEQAERAAKQYADNCEEYFGVGEVYNV